MTPKGLPARTSIDLKTLTGRTDAQIPVHKAYLRMSFLELERNRHAQEVRALHLRLGIIDTRLREIDAEIAGIVENRKGDAPRARAIEARHREPVGRQPLKRTFQLSY